MTFVGEHRNAFHPYTMHGFLMLAKICLSLEQALLPLMRSVAQPGLAQADQQGG